MPRKNHAYEASAWYVGRIFNLAISTIGYNSVLYVFTYRDLRNFRFSNTLSGRDAIAFEYKFLKNKIMQ